MVLIVSSTIALAHPGKTDSNGGHYNTDTGQYHYHHGYPEHLHTNGECPYNFKDLTESNSNNKTNITETDVKSNTKDKNFFIEFLQALFALVIFYCIPWFIKLTFSLLAKFITWLKE